jgi:RNA polymerase sigma-54 factor
MESQLETDPEVIAGKLDTDLANVFPDDHGRPAEETTPVLPAETWS